MAIGMGKGLRSIARLLGDSLLPLSLGSRLSEDKIDIKAVILGPWRHNRVAIHHACWKSLQGPRSRHPQITQQKLLTTPSESLKL